MYLFWLMFIINLPIILIYRSSTVNYNYNNRYTTFISRLSIGNLEQNDPFCTYTSLQDQQDIELKCMADYAYMTTLEAYGLAYARDIHTGGRTTDPEKVCNEVNFIYGEGGRQSPLPEFPEFLSEPSEGLFGP